MNSQLGLKIIWAGSSLRLTQSTYYIYIRKLSPKEMNNLSKFMLWRSSRAYGKSKFYYMTLLNIPFFQELKRSLKQPKNQRGGRGQDFKCQSVSRDDIFWWWATNWRLRIKTGTRLGCASHFLSSWCKSPWTHSLLRISQEAWVLTEARLGSYPCSAIY